MLAELSADNLAQLVHSRGTDSATPLATTGGVAIDEYA
jgi:hypothetical protein